MLSLISQVIEKVIHIQTSTINNSRNLLYNDQSSFRNNHSTDFCLSFLNSKIQMGFDQGLITDIILIDLQNTFATIDHETLPQKLYGIGFFKHSVNWFWCYLINITLLVNLDVSPVVYLRDLFLVLYFFSYMLLTYPKLLNVIFSFKLMIYALLVKIKILMKLKNS